MRKTGWHNSLKVLSIFFTIFWFILLIAALVTEQQTEGIVVFGIIFTLCLILMLYLTIYSIKVYDERIEIKSIFGYKKYDFEKVIIIFDESIRIKNLEHKELARISYLLDPNDLIYHSYVKYCKTNHRKEKSNNKIRYNFYVRNFCIFGIIYSLIMFLLAFYFIYIKDDLGYIIFWLLLGIISLILSIIGILSYINFEILVLEDNLVITNFLGQKEIYHYTEVSAQYKKVTIRLKIKKKKKILLYYLLDNANILY